MAQSILIRKSFTRVFGALVLVAGSTSAVACPPEECTSQGQQGEARGHVQMLRDLPVIALDMGQQGHAVPMLRDLPLLITAMNGEHLPLVALASDMGPESQSLTVISKSDGSDTYTVTIQGGKVSAQANGKDLPDDQIRRKGDTIELLDKDGDVVAKFQAPSVTEAPAPVRERARARAGTFTPLARTAPADTNIVVGRPVEPPPVMLGITMSDAPSDDTDGVTLTSILPGLPAEKAGLSVGDRVVEMDGKKIQNQMDLREVIRSKKAGEDLKIKVVRDGQDKEITVHLEAFSAERMKDAGAPQWWERMQQSQATRESKWEEAKQQIERAIEQLRSNPNLNSEKLKEKAVVALEKALRSLEESKAKMQAEIHAWTADPNRGAMILGDRPQQLFVTPAPPAPPAAPQNDEAVLRRMERIADSLERLDKRLDEIEKRLDEREQGSKPRR